jgi:hypothetical protein
MRLKLFGDFDKNTLTLTGYFMATPSPILPKTMFQ